MKPAIAAIAIGVVLASTSAAAEWVKVDETDNGTQYIDPTTIKRDGDFRRVWELIDVKTGSGKTSFRSLNEYDCKEERLRRLSFSVHSDSMARGRTLSSSDTPGEWAYIAPQTMGVAVLKKVCDTPLAADTPATKRIY